MPGNERRNSTAFLHSVVDPLRHGLERLAEPFIRYQDRKLQHLPCKKNLVPVHAEARNGAEYFRVSLELGGRLMAQYAGWRDGPVE